MTRFSVKAAVWIVLLAAGAVEAQDTNLPKVIRDGFARSESICRDIENIRGLKFKKKVKTAVQSNEDFRKFVKKSVLEQYGEEGAKWYTRALVKIGALEKDMDLIDAFIKILEDQAAAHYDADSGKCYLLMTDVDPLMLDVILSHELCHALQDQYFDLQDLVEKNTKAIRDNGDATMARECLVEGDATVVMMYWLLMNQSGMEDPAVANAAVSVAIGMQGALDYDRILAMSDENKDSTMLGGFGNSMKAMKDLPRFLMESLYTAYIQGSVMVNLVKEKGGWKAVDGLYREPPQSTEQILHPEKLTGKREIPVDVRMPELKKKFRGKWSIKEEDVMGELGIRILFEIWSSDEERDLAAISTVAAGWGGDRYYYLVNDATGKDLLAWNIVWDTRQDAGEFVTAYRTALASRFPKMKKADQSKAGDKFIYQVWEVEPGRFLKLVTQDKMVGILDTTDSSCLDLIWK